MHPVMNQISLPICRFWLVDSQGSKTLFVSVEVIRSSQPTGVMFSVVSLPHHIFTGQALSLFNQYCAHSFARNWQLPFLNQQKRENDHRKYFMINLHKRMFSTWQGSNLKAPDQHLYAHPTESPRGSKATSSTQHHKNMWLCNFDPLKPHFYIVKLVFTGVYIIFLFLLKNIDFGYSLEPHHRGGSNEYPQSMFWAEIWIISEFFIWKFSFFWW